MKRVVFSHTYIHIRLLLSVNGKFVVSQPVVCKCSFTCSNINYMCVWMYAAALVPVCVCVRARACVRACECVRACVYIYNLSRPCLRWLTLISDHYSLTNPHSTPSLTVMAPLSSSVLLPFMAPMFTEKPETAIDCLTSSLHTWHPIPYRKQFLSDLQWPLCHSPHHYLAASDPTAPRCHCLN